MNAKIKFYAQMVYSTKRGAKTPKYTITSQAGYYPPMEDLKGRDGLISMFLMEKLKEKEEAPSMRLQAKDSLNFTGLKEFFIDGKLSGYAYGYPLDKEKYGKEKKANPFYNFREDGFLFIIHQDEKDPTKQTPTYIELIVLERAKVLISAYCKQLKEGGFDGELRELRKQALNNM